MRTFAREHPELELGNLVPLLRLESLARSFEAFQRSVLEPFELAASDFRVLAALQHPGSPQSQSPSQLATRLGLAAAAAQRLAPLPRQQREEIGKALAQLAAAFEGESRPR